MVGCGFEGKSWPLGLEHVRLLGRCGIYVRAWAVAGPQHLSSAYLISSEPPPAPVTRHLLGIDALIHFATPRVRPEPLAPASRPTTGSTVIGELKGVLNVVASVAFPSIPDDKDILD